MWQLLKLRAEGFRLFKTPCTYTADAGVTFVAGENADTQGASSNMAGKSTLAMLLPFALYGCDLNGDNIAASCVSTGVDSARVKVRFVNGTDTLSVTRIRYERHVPSGASKNECEFVHTRAGKVQRVKGAAVDVQPHIDAVFGTRELFLAAHCFGCATTQTPFADAGDRVQRRLFDLLINSTDLEAARTSVAQTLTLAQAAHTQTALDIERAEGKVEVLTARLQQLRDDFATLQATAAVADTSPAVDMNALIQRYAEAHKQVLLRTEKQKRIAQVYAKRVATIERKFNEARTALRVASAELQTLRTLQQSGRCPVCRSRPSAIPAQRVHDAEAKYRKAQRRVEDLSLVMTARKHAQTHDNAAAAAAVAKAQRKRQLLQDVLEKARLQQQNDGHQKERHTSLQQDIAQCEATLAAVNITALRTQAQEQAQRIKHLQFLLTVFGPTGVRAHRFDLITPLLNSIAAKFSDVLFGDGTRLLYSTQSVTKTQELRERFECALYKQERGKWKPVGTALSAGQRMRRDIIHTFSMATLARQLNKASVSVLLLDEVFRTLDAKGIERVVACLHDIIAQGDIRNILVIEHNDDLRAMFSTCVVVRRSGNQATIAHA